MRQFVFPTIIKLLTVIILTTLIYACKKKELTIPKNVDSEFKVFLDFFNKDPIFQMSRVNFPVKVIDFYTTEFELKERIVTTKEYSLKTFSINKTDKKEHFSDYEQTITIDNERAIIEITGIANGIGITYEFRKIQGRWELVTWIDQST